MKLIVMRTILLFVLLFSLNVAFGYNQGDILFQESKSSQSKYIKVATGSRYTHCGIIYKKRKISLNSANVLTNRIQSGQN